MILIGELPYQMQSMSKSTSANRPAKLTIFNTLKFIYTENGIKGLYRGVTPRIGLGIWQTVCMVSFADYVKAWYVIFCQALAAVRPRANIYIATQGEGEVI